MLALAAGCGGSSSPRVAQLSSVKGSGGTSSGGGGAAPESKADGEQAMVTYAKCMRSNGVPNFPDPGASGAIRLGAGADPSSPPLRAAQAKCQKLLPGGGLAPGSTTQPSAQTLAHYVKVAQCMRRHGVSGFPDPTSSVPSKGLGASGIVADREGAVFAIPATMMQSPGFTQAAAACGFGLHNH
jgi:hypothetical protein